MNIRNFRLAKFAPVAVALLLLSEAATAQSAKKLTKEAGSYLASKDADLAGAGVAKVQEILKDQRVSDAGGWVADQGTKDLLKSGHGALAAELALAAIPLKDNSPEVVAKLARRRVEGLLAVGKAAEALDEAKRAFNVATMAGTREAIDLCAKAFEAKNPDNKAIGRLFKLQMLADGVRVGERPMLKNLKVPIEPYSNMALRFRGESFAELTMRGNLMLLADRLDKAREAFEQAYRISTDDELATASESLARLIKAEDGTILRAHAFVIDLSKRPAK